MQVLKRRGTALVLLVAGLMIWARVFKGNPMRDIAWYRDAGPWGQLLFILAGVIVLALAVWGLRRFLRGGRPDD